MMRININLSDELKFESEQKAKSLGVSLSAYTRLLLTRESGQMSKVDRSLLEIEKEGFEPVDYQDFKADLDSMIKNADA
jgi:hypothetical protein